MQLQSLVLTSTILSMAIWSCLTEEPTNRNVCFGITGSPGRDGREGSDGTPGTKGDKGEKGERVLGPPGKAGPAGQNGAKGEQGPKGEKGQVGQKGDPGAVGMPGRIGGQGPPGINGPPGPKGTKGDTGYPGLKGQSADMHRIAQLEAEIQDMKTTISNLEKRESADMHRITQQEAEIQDMKTTISNLEKRESADMHRFAQLEAEIQDMKTTNSNLEKRMQFTGWSNYGHKRFGTKNDQLTFDEGVNFCKEASGEIAMPADEGENAALMKLVPSSGAAYLSLNDRVTEGSFKDVSGNHVTFTKWKSGEPNNYRGNEDCSVITSDGTWNDVLCSQSYTIICQFR